LRQQTGAGRECVAERDESELGRAPKDEIFAQPGEMHSDHGESEKKFSGKVAVAYGIEAVLAQL
jgi:hypothetical protein